MFLRLAFGAAAIDETKLLSTLSNTHFQCVQQRSDKNHQHGSVMCKIEHLIRNEFASTIACPNGARLRLEKFMHEPKRYILRDELNQNWCLRWWMSHFCGTSSEISHMYISNVPMNINFFNRIINKLNGNENRGICDANWHFGIWIENTHKIKYNNQMNYGILWYWAH